MARVPFHRLGAQGDARQLFARMRHVEQGVKNLAWIALPFRRPLHPLVTNCVQTGVRKRIVSLPL